MAQTFCAAVDWQARPAQSAWTLDDIRGWFVLYVPRFSLFIRIFALFVALEGGVFLRRPTHPGGKLFSVCLSFSQYTELVLARTGELHVSVEMDVLLSLLPKRKLFAATNDVARMHDGSVLASITISV